ncbi:hypothetical protein [Nocardioides sp. L-11A]|uniref:hypothetical protein n=1 Tax=Nocardioides sp. L-11A TaxID=3043848 RepID=UPI00249BAB7F|nr:hypothetical protein QJ852_00080 [Nocardioides sp. L-11A]
MPTEGDGEIAASSSADSNPVSTSATTGLHPTPIAVVIDANLWHKHLNVDRLAAHAARLQKSGIDVWVPEQVALEWAEHAHEEIQQIAERWKKPEVAGICGPLPGPSSIHDVVATVIEILQSIPNVKVIEMTGAAAIAGIKDQILKTGSGKRENGVKTGASDSSFVRDALAAAGDDPSKVLFVSGNTRDIEAAAAAAGHTHVNSTKESRL